MKLYRAEQTLLVENEGQRYRLSTTDWDELVKAEDLEEYLTHLLPLATKIDDDTWDHYTMLKPIVSQEVWASGVTYLRSRDARMTESEDGGDCYDRVYDAERPEIFFKATPARTVGPGERLRIRRDSSWDVPEPELTLMINPQGKIQGYTIGNDMSSRSIEGQNPLYLPQAKTYERCAAVGPCILVTSKKLSPKTAIRMEISRDGKPAFAGEITIDQIKRQFEELVSFLFAECEFPNGCFLMTGTGIVPSDDFTLEAGDTVAITIDGIGTLVNEIEQKN